ncbi:MAG: M48 family metalloprotease [Candidatus Azotimanducaceae bacterium WSBS_2022_MAG_OTU7]
MITRLALAIVVLLTLGGCVTNPVTGKSELALVSREGEIAIGIEQYQPAQQSQGGQYQVDADLTAYVQQVGDRLAAVSDSDLPYEFVVLNNSSPNAWALPGGKIAINRGLLVSLDNEAELAAVLGHEIVHAAARHGARSMERNILLQGAALITAISTSDSKYANYIMGGAMLGSQLISQRYGRQAELESDYYGMKYMARAGYDPAAAISLQEKFVELDKERKASWVDGLFASHPPSELRVATNIETNEAIRSTQSVDWETGKNRFIEQLAYLRSQSDAYAAYDQATALAAKKETTVALKRINRAISLEPREPRFYGLKANIQHSNKAYRDALGSYDSALRRDDNYYEYYLGRGLTYSKLGDRAKASADLERSNQLLPTSVATNELGTLSLQEGDRSSAKRYFAAVARSEGPFSESATDNYIRLDIADNPSNYLQALPEDRNGTLVAAITNTTRIPIQSAVVRFTAVINGKKVAGNRNLGPIQANSRIGISSGWRFKSDDVVASINAQVISIQL